MPKMNLQHILDHADELAARFETGDIADLHPTAPLQALDAATRRRAEVEADIAGLVAACRTAGWPWADIGRALGVSPQAAQQRYGKLAADTGRQA